MIVVQGPRGFAAEHDLVDADHERSLIEAFRHPGLEIARAIELVEQPALAESRGIGGQRVARAARTERRMRGFGGEHAGLDGAVAALDARRVEEARVIADQAAAREGEL